MPRHGHSLIRGGGPFAGAVGQTLRRRLHQHAPAFPPAGGGAGTSAPAFEPRANPYDFSGDAIYQQAHAGGVQRLADAEAQSLAARKQLAIDMGDPSLAPDAESAAAASANPFSRAAGLRLRQANEPRALDQSLAKDNLIYSSTAGTRQADLQRSFLADQSQNQSEARSRLGDILSALAGARQDVAEQDVSAQQEAAGRRRDQLGDSPVGQTYALPGLLRRSRPLGGPAGGAVGGAVGQLARRRPAFPRHPRH